MCLFVWTIVRTSLASNSFLGLEQRNKNQNSNFDPKRQQTQFKELEKYFSFCLFWPCFSTVHRRTAGLFQFTLKNPPLEFLFHWINTFNLPMCSMLDFLPPVLKGLSCKTILALNCRWLNWIILHLMILLTPDNASIFLYFCARLYVENFWHWTCKQEQTNRHRHLIHQTSTNSRHKFQN